MKRTLATSLIALIWPLLAASAAEPAPEAPPAFHAGNEELRGYILEALENHPMLKAEYAEWRAALERIPQAGALEDPMFSYSQFLVTDETYFMVGLEQKFPWFGTRAVRREKAAADAESWLAQLHDQRNAVVRAVKAAYFDYAWLTAQQASIGEQAGIMDEAVAVARAQYEAGWSSEAEVLRMEQELARMQDMRTELDQMEPAGRAALNGALNRPTDGPLAAPAPADFPATPPEGESLDDAIRANSPALRVYDHAVDAGEKDVELARRMKYPDITVGVDYGLDRNMRAARTDPFEPGRLQTYRELGHVAMGEPITGALAIDLYETFRYKMTERGATDELKVTVGVNLPIWKKKIRAGIAEKEHMVETSRWRKENELRELSVEARESLFAWKDATRRIGFYGTDLRTREETILEGLRAQYAVGDEEVSIPAMLDSMRSLMEFRLEELRAVRDKHQAAANLEFLIGTPW